MTKTPRIGGVIVSHGQLANELLAAAENGLGDLPFISAVSIGWHDDVEMVTEQISQAITNVSNGRGVLVLTDMFGGTPTNIAATFLTDGEVEIVTGVNLPMVMKLATTTTDITLHELAKEVEDQGKESICRAGMLLEPHRLRKDG